MVILNKSHHSRLRQSLSRSKSPVSRSPGEIVLTCSSMDVAAGKSSIVSERLEEDQNVGKWLVLERFWLGADARLLHT